MQYNEKKGYLEKKKDVYVLLLLELSLLLDLKNVVLNLTFYNRRIKHRAIEKYKRFVSVMNCPLFMRTRTSTLVHLQTPKDDSHRRRLQSITGNPEGRIPRFIIISIQYMVNFETQRAKSAPAIFRPLTYTWRTSCAINPTGNYLLCTRIKSVFIKNLMHTYKWIITKFKPI